MSDSSPISLTLLPPRILLSLLATFTAAGGYLADWNETHVFNPRWPPHAKFHNGQTMSAGLGLGLLTAYYTWRPTNTATMAGALDNLFTATLLSGFYWATCMSAILYPGSDWCDEEFRKLGTPQKNGAPVIFGLSWVAYGLARARAYGMGAARKAKEL